MNHNRLIVWESYTFQHRYIPGYTMPKSGMEQGKYKSTSDWYEVDRKPRLGEKCTDYILHVLQAGKLMKTTYDTFEVTA